MENNNPSLDEEKLQKMLIQMLMLEKENNKKQEFRDTEMVSKLLEIVRKNA